MLYDVKRVEAGFRRKYESFFKTMELTIKTGLP
jgi:hypothetical protein